MGTVKMEQRMHEKELERKYPTTKARTIMEKKVNRLFISEREKSSNSTRFLLCMIGFVSYLTLCNIYWNP